MKSIIKGPKIIKARPIRMENRSINKEHLFEVEISQKEPLPIMLFLKKMCQGKTGSNL